MHKHNANCILCTYTKPSRIQSTDANCIESAPTSCKAHILKIEDSWTSAFHLKLKAPFQLKDKISYHIQLH